jgi:HTH-type transcriptional regulator, sugar sensing transcriptional regulator
MNEQKLEEIGFTRNEARVYLALLSLGTTSSKAIIEKTSLHRQLVYDALDRLIEKGLVSFISEAKRKYFKASDPENLLDIFNKKAQEIEKQKKEFSIMIKELKELQEKHLEEQGAEVFRGKKGINSLLNDMLKQKKEILTIASSEVTAEAFRYHAEFNLPKFHLIREKNKTPLKIIFSEEMKDRARKLNKLKFTESKVLPKEFTSNSSTNIYGEKVSIILWGAQPFGILIKSKELALNQKKHFELLWKIAKKT